MILVISNKLIVLDIRGSETPVFDPTLIHEILRADVKIAPKNKNNREFSDERTVNQCSFPKTPSKIPADAERARMMMKHIKSIVGPLLLMDPTIKPRAN